MKTQSRIIFNVLAKDLENAKEIHDVAGDSVLIGVMAKDYHTTEEAVQYIHSLQAHGIHVSVGLGNADPTMWKIKPSFIPG